MIVKGYLIINSKGSCRFVKTKVGVAWNEVLMAINMEIPNSVFKRPLLNANIKIGGDLQHEFNYEIEQEIQEVLETLPNIHLLNINIRKEEEDEQ